MYDDTFTDSNGKAGAAPVFVDQPVDAMAAGARGEALFATAFFDGLLGRYPLLARMMSRLTDLGGEVDLGPGREIDEVMQELLPALSAVVLALELARGERALERVDVVDFCRLYEACVYTVSTSVYQHQSRWPEEMAKELIDHQREGDVSAAAVSAERQVLEYYECAGIEGNRDLSAAGFSDYLRAAGRKTRLHLDLELFLYCVALLAKRASADPEVATYALSPEHRFSFIGNPIAAFFKATGLIATPHTPMTHLRLGYELCSSALQRFPGQAGAHHSAALYQLRLAVGSESSERAEEWLTGALQSASQAITLDPEWPEFYATRGAARRRLRDYELSRLDYQTAIELVLRCPEEHRQHLGAWIEAWTAALEQLADQRFAEQR